MLFGWCKFQAIAEKRKEAGGDGFYVNLGLVMANCYRGGERGGDPPDLPGLSSFVAQLAVLLSSG